MFRSLRWRLVLSFISLTLLAILLVSLLALAFISRSARDQEASQLQASAEGVSRQALLLMQPEPRRDALQVLAYSASFLGNVQVRVLDARMRPLVDSGPHPEEQEFAWLALPEGYSLDSLDSAATRLLGDLLGDLPPEETRIVPFDEWYLHRLAPLLPPDTELTTLRRTLDGWVIRTRFVIDPTGTLVQTGPPEESPLPGGSSEAWRSAERSEAVILLPIGSDEEPAGYVEIRNGPALAQETLRTARRAFGLAAIGATVISALAGLFAAHRLRVPLRKLALVADRMGNGELDARTEVRGDDEIGVLARSVNRMAESLQRAFRELEAERNALRRFVADASHELRTPITALKSFNELLQGPSAEDPALRTDFVDESERQIERLEWITANLLDLSRLDAGLVQLDKQPVDVTALLDSVAADVDPLARQSRVALEVVPPGEPLLLTCDRTRVQAALANLVTNACKHAASGLRVQLGAERAGDSARFWVRDSGPGIHPDDLPHLFERFYRGRAASADGSGLGLSIVQSVVQAHGGRVDVQSEPGHGSAFSIELPLSPANR